MNFFEIALLSALTGLAVMFYVALKDRKDLQMRLDTAFAEVSLLNRFYNKGRDALHKERQVNDTLRKELKASRKQVYELQDRAYARNHGMVNDTAWRAVDRQPDPQQFMAATQFRSQDFAVAGVREGDGIVGVGAPLHPTPTELKEPGGSLSSSVNSTKPAEDDGTH